MSGVSSDNEAAETANIFSQFRTSSLFRTSSCCFWQVCRTTDPGPLNVPEGAF